MITYFLSFFNKWTGQSGNHSTTYKTKAAVRKARREKMRRHPDRAYGIVARTGGNDGR